jgi:hypothetical protein
LHACICKFEISVLNSPLNIFVHISYVVEADRQRDRQGLTTAGLEGAQVGEF